MIRFETSPHFKTLPGVKLKDKPFALTQPLVYCTDVLPDMPRIQMQVGFRSDLATIPRAFRRIFSVAGLWRDAAWPHDFCCAPVDDELNPIPHFCDHKQAAEIFLEAMLDSGVEKKTARFLAWCVKTGGPKFKSGEE